MEWKVTCPRCGSHDVSFFLVPATRALPASGYARCQVCKWRSEDHFGKDHVEISANLEYMLTPRPRTIIDELRAMSDEELAARLAGSNVDTICDLCTDKHGACDAIGPHSDELCAKRILTYLRTPLTEEKEETTMQELTLNEYQRLAQRTTNEEYDDFPTIALKKIDANALKPRCFRSREFNCDTGSFDLPVVPWHDIEDVGTLDYAPVKHAEWVQHDDFDEEANVYLCSLCGEDWQLNAGTPADNNMNFCPCCGAKMDLKGDS